MAFGCDVGVAKGAVPLVSSGVERVELWTILGAISHDLVSVSLTTCAETASSTTLRIHNLAAATWADEADKKLP